MDEQQAIRLLRKYAPDEKRFNAVLMHSKKVQEISLKIAECVDCDKEFIRTASLLHDIGRFKHPPGKDTIKHGIAGSKILRREGFESLARVAERHLGVGISKKDIEKQGLDLPKKDFMPISVEEKIITYADNLVFGDKKGTLKMVIDRFEKEIGSGYKKKVMKLHNELERLKKNR